MNELKQSTLQKRLLISFSIKKSTACEALNHITECMSFIKHSASNLVPAFVLLVAYLHFGKINFNLTLFVSQKYFTIIYINLESCVIRYPLPVSEININWYMIVFLNAHFCVIIYWEIISIFVKIWSFYYIHIFVSDMIRMNLSEPLTVKKFTIKFELESVFLWEVVEKTRSITTYWMHIRIIIFIFLSTLL